MEHLTLERVSTSKYIDIGLPALILVSGVALILELPTPAPQLLGFLLIAILPLLTWSRLLRGTVAERMATAGGLVLLLNSLASLLLTYLPGPVSPTIQVMLHTLVALLPLAKRRVRQITEYRWASLWPILITLLILGTVRLPALGYSEFQGDEGVIMSRAAAVITGDESELFLHQKGPIEILLPLSLWNAAGSINELWARSLFTWASALAVLALICLTTEWFGRLSGLTAGLMFGFAGFNIAFGRIVQYQSLVMLWGLLAVFCAVKYRRDGQGQDLLLAALFMGGGLLAHYDAILVSPAIAWLMISRLWEQRKINWREWTVAAAAGGLILAMFYLPYALNPIIGRTGQYLLEGRLGAGEGRGLLSWSGPAVWRMLTLYNSTYYVVGLVLLIGFAGWSLWQRRENLAAVLLFLVPVFFYLLIVADPRTHVYTLFPGGVAIAGFGISQLSGRIQRRRSQLIFATGGAILFFLAAINYGFLLFIDHQPERQRTWAENRPAGYWTSWEDPPLYGLFGFPHQTGWRAVPALLEEKDYPFASNEEKEITNWYLGQRPRTHCPDFNSFVMTTQTQDEIPFDPVSFKDWQPSHLVTVEGRQAIQLYSSSYNGETTVIEAADTMLWRTPADIKPLFSSGDREVGLVLGDGQLRLLGYDISADRVAPGQSLKVTLYWQALAPFDSNFQVFVHLYDGQMVAQDDGAPECDINPTTRWEPGQLIVDPHILEIPADATSGKMKLLVGMYELVTEVRLPVQGDPNGVMELLEVVIEVPE